MIQLSAIVIELRRFGVITILAAGLVTASACSRTTDSPIPPDAKYTYCFATGGPPGPTGKQQYYLTQPFALKEYSLFALPEAFEKFLQSKYPGETIDSGCMGPNSLEKHQQNHQNAIASKRKTPDTWAVVEVDWKPYR